MGRIVVSENVTLDGVVQDPTGEEGFKFGGWFSRAMEKDREAWAEVEAREAMQAEAMLLGGRTYDYLATRWTEREGAWADRLRTLPKYIVSSARVLEPAWENSTRLEGYVPAAVAELKQRIDGDIVVNGSGRLVRTLLENDQVDELRLMVFPYVLGRGDRLFGETTDMRTVRLVGNQAVGEALTLLTYHVMRGE